MVGLSADDRYRHFVGAEHSLKDTQENAVATLELADIQGNILRGYRIANVRHFALTFGTTEGAQSLLGLLSSGNGDQAPQVTPATVWDEPPDYCLNIGLTADGLRMLGLSKAIMALFPAAFLRGPTFSAAALGDTGEAAPEHWVLGGPNNPAVHALLSLYTEKTGQQDQLTAWLTSLFSKHDVQVALQHDGKAFPGDKIHFGYRDGISQPHVEGSPAKEIPDMQPVCKTGEFLLGKDYVNQFGGNFAADIPRQLADNGSYAAFRILKQDVFAFERFIRSAGAKYNMDPELVAAKMAGRWRSGTPLVKAPEADRVLPDDALNSFDYAPTDERPEYFDDAAGFRCPIGSHMRRMNPRSALVMGKPHTRRIIRRNFPYGPELEDNALPDDIERGLIGFFVCGDLEMQFEFLQKIWANLDIATTGIRGTRDPLIGAQPEEGGQFVIRTKDRSDPVIFDEVPRLVITRGSVYCFLPSISALKFLAQSDG